MVSVVSCMCAQLQTASVWSLTCSQMQTVSVWLLECMHRCELSLWGHLHVCQNADADYLCVVTYMCSQKQTVSMWSLTCIYRCSSSSQILRGQDFPGSCITMWTPWFLCGWTTHLLSYVSNVSCAFRFSDLFLPPLDSAPPATCVLSLYLYLSLAHIIYIKSRSILETFRCLRPLLFL